MGAPHQTWSSPAPHQTWSSPAPYQTWSSPAPHQQWPMCIDNTSAVIHDSGGMLTDCYQLKQAGLCHNDPPPETGAPPGWGKMVCCQTCSSDSTWSSPAPHQTWSTPAPDQTPGNPPDHTDGCEGESCCGVGTEWKDGACIPSYHGVMEACKENRGDYFFTCGSAASCDTL